MRWLASISSKDNSPKYLQISFRDIVIHLTEHHGDCSPGASVYIAQFENLEEFHAHLTAKNYAFNKPGLEITPWDLKQKCMEVIDPFGNRLSFSETILD